MTSDRATPPNRRGFPLRLEHLHSEPRRLVEPADRTRGGPAVATAGAAGLTAAPTVPPGASGVGLDGAVVRERMVERLRASGIRDEAVLGAMGRIPRHLFVDSALVAQAYEDTSLPIGLSQTISKPSVVARMIELLRRGQPTDRRLGKVLEIGTGCGYQAAVLAELARQVYSIERLRPLHDKARGHLAGLRRENLRLIFGDGRFGHPPNAPYDAIISAAGGEDVPETWLDQLAPGGRLVAPTSLGPQDHQVLVVIDRNLEGELVRTVHEAVRFVPLKSGIS